MIEHYCKKNTNGHIPGKESIPEILRKAKQDFDAICGNVISRIKKKRNKGNPSRNVLVEHSVLFPNASSDSDSSDDASQSKLPINLKRNDLINRAVPKNKEEETNQLEMAMQASINNWQSQTTG